MKKITLVLLTLLTLLPLGAWAEEYVQDNVTYEYTPVTEGDGTATIKSVGNVTGVTILASFTNSEHTYNVTGIQDGAFSACTDLNTITFEGNTLDYLYANAFANDYNKTLIVTYKGIQYSHQGDSMYSGDSFIVTGHTASVETDISIKNDINGIHVTGIADNALTNLSGHSVHIPQYVTTISSTAFATLGTGAASNANNLTNITVDANNSKYSTQNGALYATEDNKIILVTCPVKNDYSGIWKTGITAIGDNAFICHRSLATITIPATVKTIGQSAFHMAGASLDFNESQYLNVSFGSGSQLTSIGTSAFQESGLSSITLPNGLNTIGQTSFKGCSKLTSVTLPSQLEYLLGGAFRDCNLLATVTFTGNKLKTISEYAFYNCLLERTINIPAGVETIQQYAFNVSTGTFTSELCYSNSAVNIPNSVTSIAETAFPTGLKKYYLLHLTFDETEEWATYYSIDDLELPANVEAWTITNYDATANPQLSVTQLHYIHKNKAILLHRTEGAALSNFWCTSPSADNVTADNGVTFNTSLFNGSTTGVNLTSFSGDKYVLSGDEFVKANYGSLDPYRCYLLLTNANNPSKISFEDTGINEGDKNSFIYMEDDNIIAKNTAIGYASLVKDGELMKLTVTPGTSGNYYAYKSDITIKKIVTAVSGRAPSLDNTTWTGDALTIVGENQDPDPSGTIEYTFDPAGATAFEVTVNFHKRKFFNDNDVNKYKEVSLAYTSTTYDGTAKEPAVNQVKFGTKEADAVVVDPKNYTVSYADNTAAGSASVTITGQREFRYTYTVPFSIAKRDINNITVNKKLLENCAEDQRLTKTFTGSAITLTAEELGISDLKPGSTTEQAITENDYQVTYENNTNVSTTTQKARINIVSKTENGVNYQSTKVLYFTILSKVMTDENVANIPDQDYTGEAVEPALTITYLNNTFTKGTDYDVVYTDNINSGIATATITFKGNYSGEVVKHFGIRNHAQTISVNFENPDNQWTTYYYKENLALVDGLKAYVVTGRNGLEVQTTEVGFIPRNTAVLLFSESGTKSFNLTTDYSATLPTGITPDNDLFKGTETNLDISTVEGTKFVLVNGKFIQAKEGTLAANRCYLVVTDPIDVAELTINKAGNEIIFLENGTPYTGSNVLCEASTSAPKDGKVTLTVKPKRNYYVELSDITVVKNVNAGSARAQQIDGGNVVVTAGNITDNSDDYTTTYEFTYPYEANCQYQITVNFHEATHLLASGKQPTITIDNPTYNGREQNPEPTVVTYDGITLTKGIDYVVTYPGNDYINAGKNKAASIIGIRKYTDNKGTTFEIKQRSVNDITVAGKEGQTWVKDHELDKDEPQVVFTGSEIKLDITDVITVKDAENNDQEKSILSDNDLTITYSKDITNVGSASVTIKANENTNYTGQRTVPYTIVAKEMTADNIAAISDQNYTGSEIKPALTIKYGEIKLVEGEDKDYTVAYSNNVVAGDATATVTFRGNYSGTATKTFKIVESDETLTINFDSDNEWTTYYATKNLKRADDIKVYVVTKIEGLEVVAEEVGFIPKETPVLLHRESGEKTSFEVQTCSNETLTGVTLSDTFQGTLTDLDIASISGTKFVLHNGQFVQAGEGTLAANRCYLVMNDVPEGVTKLDITKAGNAFIYQEDGKATTANLGTASTSEAKDGKVTLTVKPTYGYYVEPADISVVPNTDAGTARAPEINDGKVEAGEIKVNADFTTTYEYTYAYTEGFQYQITVNFHKAANIQEQGKTTSEFAKAIYNGYEQKVEPTVTYNGTLLTKDVDYVLTYPDADYTNAGTKNVKINGIRKYQKELSPTFTIANKNVNDITVEAKEGQDWKAGLTELKPQVVYTGSEITLNITDKIKDAEGHDVELLSAEQVDITYKSNVNVGDASVTIKAKEVNYTGERTVNYAIVAKEMTADNIAAIPDQNYTGSEIKPALTIKYGNITLVEGEDKDYTVAYSNNINAGEATATVNFRDNYSGKDVKKTFKIVDVDATFTVAFDSDNEWTTYYSDKNLTLADNLKAYAITGHDGKEVNTAEMTFIPKETAVLLYSKSGEKNFNVKTCSNETLPSDIVPDRNLFKGTLTKLDIADIPGTKFVLVDGKFVQTAEGELAANRCYLVGNITGVATLAIGKGISEVITLEEGTETSAAGSARVSQSPDENGNLTLTVTPGYEFYADQEHIKVVYSVKAGSARAPEAEETPEVTSSTVELTPVEGYNDTGSKFEYTFPYTKDYFYQVTVNFQKAINLQAQGAQPTITLEEGTYVYDGTEKKPKIASVTIPVNGETVTLTENKDFKVQEYQDNINAGAAKVIIRGMNHYYNDFSKNFNIGQRDINLVKVDPIPDQTYTGKELTPFTPPALIVTDFVTIDGQEVDLLNQITDTEGNILDDYTPEATDNINVGVAKVSLKATSKNYTGIKSGITFNIVPKDLDAEGNKPTIAPVEDQYYTGEPLEPKLTIHDGELLISEDDYEVAYSNNIKETTPEAPAVANIIFKGNYKGTAQTTFLIKFKSETKALNVEFGEQDEWTTYYSPIDINEVEGLNIFVVTGLNKGQGIDLKTEKVTFIPKNIGVLLQRTDKTKTTYTGQTMPSSTTLEGVTPDTNLFRGTSTGIEDMSTIDGVKYILVDDRFIQVVEGALAANRCYVFISNEEAGDIIHVDGDDANGIIIQEEGESSTTAGQVWVELRGDGYKHITVSPASATYATKNEIKVVRSIKNTSQASSRNRAPGIENTVVEVIPEYPNEDPSSTTHYKFEYDSDYNYQVTVNFQKRINLSDPNVSHPVVTLKAEDIQDLVYDGKPKTPAVEKVTCNGIPVDPSNYDISYENNINAGRPRVTITGKRFLMGSTSTEFYIGKRNFSNVTVKEPIPDQEYNDGAPIEFKGLVLEDIVDGVNIVQATDYTVVCNDTEIGPAKVSFLPANNYEGSGKGPYSFNIIPATGIDQIVIDELEGQWFDLNGQRIEGRPTQKGVYILRDKKQRTMKVRIK